MENKFNSNLFDNKGMIKQHKYFNPKNNFYPNQNNNNIKKNINFNTDKILDNKNNNNLNNNKKYNEIKETSNPFKPNLSSKIYEKNILLLNEKIKEQENDILYLKSRLKNYDETLEEVTRLNLELNKLNEIIKEKNYTIQEYREITELSKKKFDELIKNKNELMEKIKYLETENRELKSNINNFDNNFSNMKIDLNGIIKENRDLKRQLYEKNIKIKNMNDIIEKSNINQNDNNNIDDINFNKNKNINFPENRYINDTSNILNNINNYIIKNNENNLLKERSRTPLLNNLKNEKNPKRRINNFNQDYSLRTEPNNYNYNDINTKFRY